MSGSAPGRAQVAAWLLMSGAGVLVVGLADSPSGGPGTWVLLVCAIGVATASTDMVARALHRAWRKVTERVVRACLVGLVIITFLGGLWYVSRPAVSWAQARVFGCAQPAHVRVLTTPEMLSAYREVVQEYEAGATRRNYDCPPAELHVYAPPAQRGRDGLKAGWSSEYLRDQGPRPDLWMPDSTLHVDELRKRADALGVRLDVTGSIASTEIVLGVPASLGVRLDDPDWQGRTWADLVGNLQARDWDLVRPAPTASTVGEFGTIAIYTSGGDNGDRARSFEQWVDGSLIRGGYRADGDSTHLLARQAQLKSRSRPMVVSEQALARFNADQARRAGRPGCDGRADNSGCLLAFYPTDTHALDFPAVRLSWSENPVSQEQQQAADAFRQWLLDTEGRHALVRVGLRPPGTQVSDPLAESNGVQPGAPLLYLPMDLPPAVHTQMMAVHDQAREPSAVLLSVDASGSMNTPAGDRTRFAAAAAAVAGQSDTLDASSDVMVFSATMGVREVAPAKLAAVRPGGNTPLHRAIVTGLGTLDDGDLLVVLTDGVDNVHDVSSGLVLDRARKAGVRVLVLAFGEASCTNSVLTEVTTLSGGACRDSTPENLTVDLAELLRRS